MAAALGATIILLADAALVILGPALASAWLCLPVLAFVAAIRNGCRNRGPGWIVFRKGDGRCRVFSQARPDLAASAPPDWNDRTRSVADLSADGQPDPVVVGGGQIKGLSRGAADSAAMVVAILGGIIASGEEANEQS